MQQKINNSTSDGKTVKAYIYFEINNDPTNYVNSNAHTLLLMKHENVSKQESLYGRLKNHYGKL